MTVVPVNQVREDAGEWLMAEFTDLSGETGSVTC